MREGGLKYPLKLYELWKRNEREWAGGTAGGSATRESGMGSLIKYHTTYYGEGGDTACVVSMASGNVKDTPARPKSSCQRANERFAVVTDSNAGRGYRRKLTEGGEPSRRFSVIGTLL